jgi:hypothetical protein
MRLRTLNPSHAKQCRAGMYLLQRFVRRRLGWHVALDTAQVSRPLPQSQRTRGFTAYTDVIGFTHQRRPYGCCSTSAMTRSMLPLPTQNPFAALPLDDCVDTDTETSDTDEADSPLTSGAAPATSSRQGPRAASAPQLDHAPHSPRSTPATCLGTWNVHNLNTKDSLSRLVALSHFMHYHSMGVLAVQKTRLPPQTPLAPETGLLYFGSTPVLQLHTSTRYCRGTGFLVPSAHSASFTYLGTRSPLLAGYGAVWPRWQGPLQSQPLYLASVYCPDTGAQRRNAHLLQDVYEHISAELTYYSSKPGTMCLMGDWNAHVPASSHPSVPAHLHHLAPTLGLGELNSAGRALLEFCSAHGPRVVSQHAHRSPADGPPGARPTFVRGKSAAIVDYILLSSTCSAANPPLCEVVPHDSTDVHGVSSDHSPILLPCLPQPLRTPTRERRRVTLRMELLYGPETCHRFRRVVEQSSADLLPLLQPPPATDRQHAPSHADAACSAVISMLRKAAADTLGHRTVVPGVTRPWMTRHVADVCARRCLAFARHNLDPSPLNLDHFKAFFFRVFRPEKEGL